MFCVLRVHTSESVSFSHKSMKFAKNILCKQWVRGRKLNISRIDDAIVIYSTKACKEPFKINVTGVGVGGTQN